MTPCVVVTCSPATPAGYSFDVYLTSLYPDGYGKDTTPFEPREVGSTEQVAELVVENERVVGFGVSGFVGRNRAEAWFDKV